MQKMEKLGAAIEKKFAKVDKAFKAADLGLKAMQDAIGFGVSLKKSIFKINIGVSKFMGSLQGAWIAMCVLLVLFIIHQLFVWIDQDPDIAFERAGLFFDAAEVTWDLSSVLWNAGVDVFNAGIIPLWNSMTYYLVEPTVVLLLEIFSLIFMQQHWNGLFSEADFPYNGLDCMANAEAAAWCGRYGFYKEALASPEYSAGYADDSAVLESRRHLQERNYTFGLATARHLQDLSGGGFSMPVFDSSVLTVALDALASFFVTMFPSLLDVVFGILMDVIRTTFSIIMDAFFHLLKAVMGILKMLVKSGMLTTVVTIGVDFAIIVDCSHSNPSPHTTLPRHKNTSAPLLCLRSCSPRSRCLCSLRPSTRSCACSTTSSRAVGTSNWSASKTRASRVPTRRRTFSPSFR